MATHRRSPVDWMEVCAPGLAACIARVSGRFPGFLRRWILQAACDRARDAFNRGDLEVVFALFADDVEYRPPPPLNVRFQLHGRRAVFDFWHAVFARYDENRVENLSLEEISAGAFVRKAHLHHRSRSSGQPLDYSIVQTTELRSGRVVRQVNLLDRRRNQGARPAGYEQPLVAPQLGQA